MREIHYVITDPEGIHARPAGLLVKEAAKFKASVQIKKGEQGGDAKRIFTVMGLAAKKGEEIVLQIDGIDEEEAEKKLLDFLKENL